MPNFRPITIHAGTRDLQDDGDYLIVGAGITTNTGNLNISSDGFISLSNGVSIKRTVVTSNYTATEDDTYLGITVAGPFTITLPSASVVGSGFTYIIKDEANNAFIDNITIDTTSGQTIDGSLTYIINSNYGGIGLISNGANWNIFSQFPLNKPSVSNKAMTAAVTTADGDLATATALAATPIGYIAVFVNGKLFELGDGVTTKACYFSDDGGTTAKFYSEITTGDFLYWNGSITAFELDASDVIDFLYNNIT